MSDIFSKNGLAWSEKGQQNQTMDSIRRQDLNNIDPVTIEDCIVVGVSGLPTFSSKNYTEADSGSILVDLAFPDGRTINYCGRVYKGVKAVRCKTYYDTLGLGVGCLEKDFLFDENGNRRTGDLKLTNFNYNSIQKSGEFVFALKSKKNQFLTGLKNERVSLYADKAVPHMGIISGISDKSAATKYKEIFKAEKAMGKGYV